MRSFYYYVMLPNGTRQYFAEDETEQANDFAQAQADTTGKTVVRYDIEGGQAWFVGQRQAALHVFEDTIPRLKPSPKLRAILDVIDEHLSTGDPRDSCELWAVLSALRGPDDSTRNSTKDFALKTCTTSVIRAAAFPRTAKLSHGEGGRVCASMVPDSLELREKRGRLFKIGHFISHAKSAFDALGISFEEEDEDEE
jgi:hypothetical protein